MPENLWQNYLPEPVITRGLPVFGEWVINPKFDSKENPVTKQKKHFIKNL